jgi:hypothetical protein
VGEREAGAKRLPDEVRRWLARPPRDARDAAVVAMSEEGIATIAVIASSREG